MGSEQNRVPPPTEVSPLETEVDPCPSDRYKLGVAASADRLTIGHRLSGRYRIERELGEGGMGVVYLVSDEQVAGEIFAVKVLKESLDPEALSPLREEVRKTRKLSHPNIVDVHSVNVDGTRLYVLMEYLEGKSLNALLDEEFGRGMPFSHAWPIIEDVGAALGYAHDHNVIHSDLKPANIFLTNSGKTKLLDFGIARVSRGPLLHRRLGPLALTPAYSSCEMLEGKEADRRDDIYSFACVIYEMLSGERPFGELTALEAREAGAQVAPLAVLSREQNAALAQALAFDRDRRTSSVEEFLEALAADHKPRRRPIAILGTSIIAALAAVGLTYLVLDKLWISRHSIVVQSVAPEAQQAPARAAATPNVAAFDPPPHSIAVLPFVNMSGDPSQEYFSDGLTEELLNSLSRINELQVAARTSSFSFQGEHPDIATVAHKLNVGAVLEGSVRRSAHTVRITAQLVNGVTGFHLWSQTYDRDLGDVLKLQTEIATAVASALKVTLLGDEAARIEIGGTRNPAAFDAYLRATNAWWSAQTEKEVQAAIADYAEAIRLDPQFALAYADRSFALTDFSLNWAKGAATRDYLNKGGADARKAISLAPNLAEGHASLGFFDELSLEFRAASQEFQRALALAPGKAKVLINYGIFAVNMGENDPGLAAERRAVMLDPLNSWYRVWLGMSLSTARRYDEAIATLADAKALAPNDVALNDQADVWVGLTQYAKNDFSTASATCERVGAFQEEHKPLCLAATYNKLGRHADAAKMLGKFQASAHTDGQRRVGEAIIYAQWGDTARALDSLEAAMRFPDSWLELVRASCLLDPLRNEPRFQAIERALKFPN